MSLGWRAECAPAQRSEQAAVGVLSRIWRKSIRGVTWWRHNVQFSQPAL